MEIEEPEERNRHGQTFAEWEEKARGLGAPESFFKWGKREEHWWIGMSPRWSIKSFEAVEIIRKVTERPYSFREGNNLIIGRKARNHKK